MAKPKGRFQTALLIFAINHFIVQNQAVKSFLFDIVKCKSMTSATTAVYKRRYKKSINKCFQGLV